jgi:hypothetical protein
MLKGQARKRLGKKAKKGFRGFPLATTIACYGPDGSRATKLTVGIILVDDQEPVELRRWFTGKVDVREDPDTAEEFPAFIDQFGVRSVTMVDRIIGCPHEEGIDYEGPTCPHCPMGANFRLGAVKRPVIPDKDAARILPRAEGAMA